MKKEFDWFDHPKNRKLLWILLWSVCGLSVVAEFFIHRHGHFEPVDSWMPFYAVLGFVACALSILIAKVLGFVLKKKEDYYDHDA